MAFRKNKSNPDHQDPAKQYYSDQLFPDAGDGIKHHFALSHTAIPSRSR